MTAQERIRHALDNLATAPEPIGLADKALRAADRRRATTIGAGIVAGGLVLALAALGVTNLPGHKRAHPGGSAACVQYTSGSNGLPEVPRDQWPDFVSATIAALPARSDYSMQSGSSFCFGRPGQTQPPDGPVGGAHAVIDLGTNPQLGLMRIDIEIGTRNPPADCANAISSLFAQRSANIASAEAAINRDISLPAPQVLFCNEPTSSTPLTYVTSSDDGSVMAVATYRDGTVVQLAYDRVNDGIPDTGPAITPQRLASATADPGLKATIPSEPSTSNP